MECWKFEAKHISDVTFAASSRYVWDASSAIVDQKTGRRVSVQAAYKDGTEDFTHIVEWGRKAIEWYSGNMPGVPYPYNKMTAFQGFANMEYPMMVNDSAVPEHIGAQYLLNHEIAHTWFPFYMGTNETRYAFMDEGWAVVFEYLLGTVQYGAEKAMERQARRVSSWALNGAAEHDQPIISMSGQVQGAGYRTNAYGKPGLAYLALRDMLGEKRFKHALHSYMERWNGKHPIPWDFFYSFNDALGENLNWFWTNWFFSNHYIDLEIASAGRQGEVNQIAINNAGGFAIPFDMKVTYTDGSQETLHRDPSVWKVNPKLITVKLNNSKKVKTVIINNGIYMDATPANNKKDF